MLFNFLLKKPRHFSAHFSEMIYKRIGRITGDSFIHLDVTLNGIIGGVCMQDTKPLSIMLQKVTRRIKLTTDKQADIKQTVFKQYALIGPIGGIQIILDIASSNLPNMGEC